VIRPEGFFLDGQRSAVERLRLRVLTLSLVELRQVVETIGEVGASQSVLFRVLGRRREKLLGFPIAPLPIRRTARVILLYPAGLFLPQQPKQNIFSTNPCNWADLTRRQARECILKFRSEISDEDPSQISPLTGGRIEGVVSREFVKLFSPPQSSKDVGGFSLCCHRNQAQAGGCSCGAARAAAAIDTKARTDESVRLIQAPRCLSMIGVQFDRPFSPNLAPPARRCSILRCLLVNDETRAFPDLHESVYVDALELLHSSVGPTDAEFVDTSAVTQAEMDSHVVVG